MVKLVEKPTTRRDSIVPRQPSKRTGFRPMRSERPPQNMLVRDSEREKEAIRIPAWKDASWRPKSRTMSQA
jgi:hypothetical protein